MPKIEVSHRDLNKLTGKKFSKTELEEALEYVKGELESKEGDRLKIEIADTNRPDLWSTEGVARELRAKYTRDTGLPEYRTQKSGLKVIVDKSLKDIRPKTVCAVIRGLDMNDEALFQMIQLQEKMCETFGRGREEVAIGAYDYHKITGPVYFKAYRPDGIKFVPLECKEEMSLRQILSRHPKGKEYGHLLRGFEKYPVFIDSKKQVLSMPPVINSDYTGKVTKDTKDVFIECSGFDLNFLVPALNVMVTALADRGGKVETVEVVSPGGKMETPDFSPRKMYLDSDNVRKLSGIELKEKDIKKLLARSRYGSKRKSGRTIVYYPPYRQDIMHQVDIIEDLIITYGYKRINPAEPEIAGTGRMSDINTFSKKISDLMIGTGSQEVMSYILTNRDNLVKKMRMEDMTTIEVDNPVSRNWSVFRTWITPSLIEFLGKNTNREYPQKVFEIGEVVLFDKNAETRSKNPVRLAWALAESDADFTRALQVFDFLMRSLGVTYKLKETDHPSFIEGRVGRASAGGKDIAYIGEMHPEVLDNFGIEQPVCAFELNLSDLLEIFPSVLPGKPAEKS